MMVEVEKISGIQKEELYHEIRQIHQAAGTSEYSLLLGQIPTLKKMYGDDLLSEMEPAISAFRSARRTHLRLYPLVYETLLGAKASGVKIGAYTESQAFYTAYRFRKLGLDKIVDALFSPPDHEMPKGITPLSLRSKPAKDYQFEHTEHYHTPENELKPNPELLRDIIKVMQVEPRDVVYVGDSLFKDIAMAQSAGVTDVYAEYGASHAKIEYDLLRSVSHWTDEDVEREKKISQKDVQPSFVLDSNFGQICNYIDWK